MMRDPALRSPRTFGAALMVVACLAAGPRGWAAQETQDAGALISNLGTQALQVLGPSVPPVARTARFRQLFDDDFDLPQIARFVLGPQGRRLAPDQQREFLSLFRDFLAQSYSERLAQYAGEPFRVTSARASGNDSIVTSQVVPRSGKPVEMDWHVTNRDGHLLVSDVDVDGVSMKMTQRTEFAKIIERNGGNAASILAVLRQQLTPATTTKSGSPASRPGYRG